MLKKLFLGTLLVCVGVVNLSAQNSFYGARIGAMANAGCAMSDTWNISGNPAAFNNIRSFTASLGYLNQFSSSAFSTKAGVIGFPVKSNFFGLSFNSFGEDPYHETTAGLSYGRTFGNNFSIGLKFNYHSISIANYGDASTYSVEVGLMTKVMTNLTLATHIINPSRSDFGEELQNPLLTIFRFGARYDLSDKTFIISELEKPLSNAPTFKTGLEYSVFTQLALRGGISTHPFQQYFGAGFITHHLQINLAASVHPDLGYSPQMSIGYEF
ncbi:hypothetical protein NF867_00620 [Solitalea sp. MAHUQ-68]|uniref:PorV/PorQ family protein n=1 Tax=Solitalea agri TaxID=2953739 RepID=A0A9X2F417_9SPHI|nr:hypothetical protein [Solitalea agri]MCO4291363.1 hypothetical protein [Solitalea agri]